MTSALMVEPRLNRRTRAMVYGSWALMMLLGVIWIARYTVNSPLIDEWEFIPALFDEEPTWPWFWKQHNEHRFLVPRLVYYPLFQLTHDFRTGCYVSLLGMGLLALGMIRVAQRLRGRLHWADAFFPLSMLHLGHLENYRMGYQMCFMLNAVFSGMILWVILLTSWQNLVRRGVQVGLLLIPLLGCGASGLAFGPPLALWLLVIVGWLILVRPFLPRKRLWVAALLALIAFVPGFIALYYVGYQSPWWHPPSAGILPSLRIALQSLTMSFGVAISGLWPVSGFLVAIIGVECAIRLLRVLAQQPEERPRALGLWLYLGAIAAMACGIGWGRSGFGEAANMGLAGRYAWIIWPGLAAVYYMWMLYGGKTLSQRVPMALCLAVIALLPFNIGTGFVEGEKYREYTQAWEAAVRAGETEDELVEHFYADWYPHGKAEIRKAVRLMRAHAFGYYLPLPAPTPPAKPRRGQPAQGRRRSRNRSVMTFREGIR